METIDIEAIQQELQKHGLDRLEPNDPLFMDHVVRRLELQWHYDKVNVLLGQQQIKIQTANTEFSESLRKAYSEWINDGGTYIRNCIKEATNLYIQELAAIPNKQTQTNSMDKILTISRLLIVAFVAFMSGIAVASVFRIY